MIGEGKQPWVKKTLMFHPWKNVAKQGGKMIGNWPNTNVPQSPFLDDWYFGSAMAYGLWPMSYQEGQRLSGMWGRHEYE